MLEEQLREFGNGFPHQFPGAPRADASCFATDGADHSPGPACSRRTDPRVNKDHRPVAQRSPKGDRTGGGPVTGFARHGGGQPNGLHQD